MSSFIELGVPAPLAAVLDRRGIVEPFPIQAAAIPDALAGRDILGRAPTGSGKTLAFGLPLIARLGRAEPRRPLALILAPTRELAEQIARELAPLAKAQQRWLTAVYGGVGYETQRRAFAKGVDLVVATPGRLADLIDEGTVELGRVELVVVDEADRMADMGFLPQVRSLLDQTRADRQTVLFSATLDGAVAELTRRYQRDPVRHEVAGEEQVSDAVHYFWRLDASERLGVTAEVVGDATPSIVFTRTRHGADRVAGQLDRSGVNAAAIHGGRNQNQRNRALRAFESGEVQALVATDVAARGIHVDGVASVIHFDLPADHKDYLHRSGRTARAGATGVVVSLVSPDQVGAARSIQRALGLEARMHDRSLAWQSGEGGSHIGEAPVSSGPSSGPRPQGRRRRR